MSGAADGVAALYVIGGGGFALQMLDTLERLAEAGRQVIIADDATDIDAGNFDSCSIDAIPAGSEAVIAIARPATRRLVAERRPDLHWGRLDAPSVICSRHAAVAPGAVLAHGVIIEARCRIGRHFQANLHSYVAHECTIGDCVTLAPRVSCNGNITIGDGVYVGTGAMVRQGRPGAPLLIGDGAFIGMGAIVTHDVPAGAVVKAVAAI